MFRKNEITKRKNAKDNSLDILFRRVTRLEGAVNKIITREPSSYDLDDAPDVSYADYKMLVRKYRKAQLTITQLQDEMDEPSTELVIRYLDSRLFCEFVSDTTQVKSKKKELEKSKNRVVSTLSIPYDVIEDQLKSANGKASKPILSHDLTVLVYLRDTDTLDDDFEDDIDE